MYSEYSGYESLKHDELRRLAVFSFIIIMITQSVRVYFAYRLILLFLLYKDHKTKRDMTPRPYFSDLTIDVTPYKHRMLG